MDVSIFIRSLNEEVLISRCLTALSTQKTKLTYEVILLDCSSDDRTLEIARSFGISIYTIPRNLFTYSSALNAGAQLAKGTFFVSLSAHAVPTNNSWLENLVAPFSTSANVAASFSRQLAWQETSIPEKQDIEADFGLAAWQRDKPNFEQMLREKVEPYKLLIFSNVSSCIRRDFLLTHPFYELPYCEDRALALDILSAGMAFAYTPESAVYRFSYPVFAENLSVSERKLVSRITINSEANRRFNMEQSQPYIESSKERLWSMPKVFSYNIFKAIQALCCAGAQRRRVFAYYIAELANILGQYRAVRVVEVEGNLPLKRSDPSKLLLQARKERSE